ncbi:MAG: ATP-binding cassette domain-containing protein [Phycisphaerales bacterium]|jgi:phospholipid/cholesterol/gamma-HCH transport system ATP-binding protein|nr:ATP-binding cassette domain-containing protein [Phycisphaerales bacterium]
MPRREAHGEPESLISFRDVHKRFDGPPVLDGLNLEVASGRTTVILGPSGAGKSVLLKLMIGLLQPESGEIRFGQIRVDRLPERRLGDIRRRTGFLFQQGALFDSMTVLDNVSFPLMEHTTLDAAARRARVRETLQLLGVSELMDRLPAELSGGQRKRIALARAIVLRPECMLYDEPTTGLDPIRSDVVARLIQMLRQELHPTSVVVTHDIPLAFKVADRMVLLRNGRIHMEGGPEAFSTSEDPVVRAFLDGHARDEDLEPTDTEAAA